MQKRVACVTIMSLFLLSACGQSGALQLKDDPNYDHRSSYLLYSDSSKQTKPSSSSTTQNPTTDPLNP